MEDKIAQLLALPLPRNDAGATTVKDYLKALLAEVWREEEGFSGKRPFGNSGWQYDIYGPMGRAGLVKGTTFDSDGYISSCDRREADELIIAAIMSL